MSQSLKRFSVWLVLFCCSSSLVAQKKPQWTRLMGESSNTAKRLEEARKWIEQSQWQKAIEQIETIFSSSGQDLVYLPGSSRHCVNARWLGQVHLSFMAKEGLKLYRQRVEPQARQLLQQGKSKLDRRLLQKVVGEYFCSRSSEETLLLLGDLALERGEFHRAIHWWSLLLPRDKGETLQLRYPDATTEPAIIKARILLARRLGQFDSETAWQQALGEHRTNYPKAKGYLAGKDGVLADILDTIPQSEQPSLTVTPSAMSKCTLQGKHRRWPLPGHETKQPEGIISLSKAARSIAFDPLLIGRKVLLCDAARVQTYDLDTGKVTHWHDERRFVPNMHIDFPPPMDLRFSLTQGPDCVLARLGGIPEIKKEDDENAQPTTPHSALVCLNLNENKPRLRWRISLPNEKEEARFEGSPVVDQHYAYIAVTRQEIGREVTAIHCYPLNATGKIKPEWTRDICSSPNRDIQRSRYQHHLLSLSGGRLCYCTGSGAIVALDPKTGRRLWAYRYPSLDEQSRVVPTRRDLCPCVIDAGRVYCAPSDGREMVCLNLESGAPIWLRDGIRPIHLLGVKQQRVVFTTEIPMPGIRALNAEDGSDVWYQKGAGYPYPTSWGRGFLTEDLVYWPTEKRVYVLRVKDGLLPENPTLLHRLPPGNLSYSRGVLMVTDREYLHTFDCLQSRDREGAAPINNDRSRHSKTNPPHATNFYISGPDIGRWVHSVTVAVLKAPAEKLSGRRYILPVHQPTKPISTLFAVTEGKILCLSVEDQKEQWRQSTPFAITWSGIHEGNVLAAGPKGIVKLSQKDGSIQWHYNAKHIYKNAPIPTISHFSYAMNQHVICFVQDQRFLIALDVNNGNALWKQECPAAFLRAPHQPDFFQRIKVHAETIEASTVNNHHWLIEPRSGTIIHQWQNNRKEIIKRDASTGKSIWKHSLSGLSSHPLEVPTLIGDKNIQLLLTKTNLGWLLHRLDEGDSIWEQPLLLENEPITDNWCWTKDTLYLVDGGQLRAIKLNYGQLLWSKSVSNAFNNHRVICRDKHVITYPIDRPHFHFWFRCPFVSLQWTWWLSRESRPGLGWPIQLHDAKTGAMIKSWNLPVPFPTSTSEPTLPPDSALTQQGLLLIDGSQVWHLPIEP